MAFALLTRREVAEQLQQIFPDHDSALIENVLDRVGVVDGSRHPPDIVNMCIDHLVQQPAKQEQALGLKEEKGGEQLDHEKVAKKLQLMFPDFSNSVIVATAVDTINFMKSYTYEEILQHCIDTLLQNVTPSAAASVPTKEESKVEIKANPEPAERSTSFPSSTSAMNETDDYRDIQQFDSDDDSWSMTSLDETDLLASPDKPEDLMRNSSNQLNKQDLFNLPSDIPGASAQPAVTTTDIGTVEPSKFNVNNNNQWLDKLNTNIVNVAGQKEPNEKLNSSAVISSTSDSVSSSSVITIPVILTDGVKSDHSDLLGNENTDTSGEIGNKVGTLNDLNAEKLPNTSELKTNELKGHVEAVDEKSENVDVTKDCKKDVSTNASVLEDKKAGEISYTTESSIKTQNAEKGSAQFESVDDGGINEFSFLPPSSTDSSCRLPSTLEDNGGVGFQLTPGVTGERNTEISPSKTIMSTSAARQSNWGTEFKKVIRDACRETLKKSDTSNREKLYLSETDLTPKHQISVGSFQKYRDSTVRSNKIPKLDINVSDAEAILRPPTSQQSIQRIHTITSDALNKISATLGEKTLTQSDKIVNTKETTNLGESSVDATFKKVFQEYRTRNKYAKCHGLNLSSDSNSDKDILKDKSVENSDEELFTLSGSKGKQFKSTAKTNDRKRGYMLLDFSSDSDSDDGKIADAPSVKPEVESLPDISFRTNNRERLLSPSRDWVYGHRKSNSVNTSSVSGNLSWRSPREEEDEVEQKYRPMNASPHKLPHSRFVAAGVPSNTQTNYTFTSSPKSGNTDGYAENQPATVLIESTTKITYSPHSYKYGGTRDGIALAPSGAEGARSIPPLVTHRPAVTVSFPVSQPSQNNLLLNPYPPATALSRPTLHNRPGSNIDLSSPSLSQGNPYGQPVTTQPGGQPEPLPSTSKQVHAHQLAGPRDSPWLLTHKYGHDIKRYLPQTLSYPGTAPNNYQSSTLHPNKSTLNAGASTSRLPAARTKTLNPQRNATVQSLDATAATVTETNAEDVIRIGTPPEDADDDIHVTLFEPAVQINVPDSPEHVRPILEINDDPVIIDEVIVPRFENEEVVIANNRNEERQPVLARNARVEPPLVAGGNAGPANEPEVTVVKKKTPRQEKEELKNEVLKLFLEVDPVYLDQLCTSHTGMMALNDICFTLLESDYPKAKHNVTAEEPVKPPEPKKVSSVDYFKHNQYLALNGKQQHYYRQEAHHLLIHQFPTVSVADIRKVYNLTYSYAWAYKTLTDVYQHALDLVKKGYAEGKRTTLRGFVFKTTIQLGSTKRVEMVIRMLKCRRPVPSGPLSVSMPELQAEKDFVEFKMNELATEEDYKFALQLNEQEYEDEGQCIECGCCYGEIPFDNMVQCLDGHLFCEDCLRQYAKESVYGQGKAQLLCMSEDCKSAFPKSQLEKALSSEVLLRYEDRVAEENLNLADIGDLVRCPHCDYPAIMDVGDRVFTCMNEKCKKETCRYCKEDWSDHFGKTCEEIEKKDEVKLRLEYEEKMTKAKVRTCHRCKAQFTKEDGCNKMTCRCGGKMCYICRKPNIDYNHFCQHPRDPGKVCTKCQACSLWTNPEEDDNRAVSEIQKEAAEVRKNKGFSEDKVIGVPEPPNKKRKR